MRREREATGTEGGNRTGAPEAVQPPPGPVLAGIRRAAAEPPGGKSANPCF